MKWLKRKSDLPQVIEDDRHMHIEIDSNNKIFQGVVTAIIIASLAALGSVLRPQIVMASDLKAVSDAVERIEQKVDQTSSDVALLQQAIVGQRMDYLEDQVKALGDKERRGTLTSTDAYRLDDFKDKLEATRLLLRPVN